MKALKIAGTVLATVLAIGAVGFMGIVYALGYEEDYC